MSGYDFLELKKTNSILFDVDKYKYVIGHNRWATLGKVNSTNAHPFTVGDITLVHNGTLDYWTGLDSKNYDVDSEAICHALSITSAKEVLEVLDGAFALVWYDARDGNLHLARNTERPLHFAFSKDKETLLFASEPWMIENLAPSALKMEKVYSLTIGKHVTINAEQKDLTQYEMEDFKPYVAPAKKYGYGYSYNDDWYDKYNAGKDAKKDLVNYVADKEGVTLLEQLGYSFHETITFWPNKFSHYNTGVRGTLEGIMTGNNPAQDGVMCYGVDELLGDLNFLMSGVANRALKREGRYWIILDDVRYADVTEADTSDRAEDVIVDARGEIITIDQFNELAKEGCANCSSDVEAEDSMYVNWTNDGHPFCLECTNDIEIKEESGEHA